MLGSDRERIARFKKLRDTISFPKLLRSLSSDDTAKVSKADLRSWAKRISEEEQKFVGMLSKKELHRYKTDAVPYIGVGKTKAKEPPRIDPASARRWVAQTAYKMGWAKKRFPQDTSRRYEYTRDRPRIGQLEKSINGWL